MANEITLCGLTDINGLNPNGVYTLAGTVDGKDSWERVVDATTFSVQYFVDLPTEEWHLVDDQHSGSYWAVGSGTATPWDSTWGNNGQPYGIPVVTEGVSVCPTVYTIGQAALGGTIAYINGGGASGTSGLVATVADISSGAEWGCVGLAIGTTSSDIGAGNANTVAIMAGCATAGIAARLCGDLVQGGFSDWYLPSADELNQLYLNRVAIGGFVEGTHDYYWSSTEYSNSADFAQVQKFLGGYATMGTKNESYLRHVRAVRSFPATTTCNPASHMFDTATEDGCDRVKRLWLLGYI